MKTAILYSGQARTFAQVFPNQYFHVLNRFDDCEIFVSVADDEQAPDMFKLLERFPADRVHIEIVPQPEQAAPIADPKFLAIYPPSSPPEAIYKMFWSMRRVWDFFRSQRDPGKFDRVVRMRCDLAFTRFPDPHRLRVAGLINTPWWGRYGGANDRVAVMSPTGAEHYFSVYQNRFKLRDMGCPVHPETMLATTIERIGGYPISHTLATEFVAVRLDGSTVGCDISAIDYADYARA